MGIITELKWYRDLLKVGREHRKKSVKLALEALLHFKDNQDEGYIDDETPSEEGNELVHELTKSKNSQGKKKYNLRGIAPNLFYQKIDGTKLDMRAQWVHPFSATVLIYEHSELPIIVLAAANIRADKSRLSGIKENSSLFDDDEQILGLTG